jgi:hypothetical protein
MLKVIMVFNAVMSILVLLFSPVNVIRPLLHTQLSPPHEAWDSPDQAADYHSLGTKLRVWYLTRYLAGTEERSIYFMIILQY